MSERRHRPTTIKDIASALAMSHSTVSRALNDRSLISSATKLRVREAAEALGYVPNLSARMMRGDAGLLVGLVIPDVQNDFYSRISKEIAEHCKREGLRMLLAITEDDSETERNEVRALLESRVSGIIATLTSDPQSTTLDYLKSVPSVQLMRRLPNLNSMAVCVEDAMGTELATAHLLDLGHTDIAYIGTSEAISTGKARRDGFLRAFQKRQMRPPPNAVELVPPRQEYGAAGMTRLLSLTPRPSGIVIGSSELTIGALGSIRDAGLSIPDEISIVGFGDPIWFRLLSPALTAVALPFKELADAAAKELFGQLHQGGSCSPRAGQVIQLPLELRVRGSTAPR